MHRLEFPSYGVSVRPQGTGATATDIILESKTMLPKVVIQRSELVSREEKRVALMKTESKDDIVKSFDQLLSEEKHARKELKV